MDFRPLKGNPFIYNAHGVQDFVVTKKFLLAFTGFTIITIPVIIYLLKNEDLHIILLSIFSALVIAALFALIFGASHQERTLTRWKLFAKINNLTLSENTSPPAVLLNSNILKSEFCQKYISKI